MHDMTEYCTHCSIELEQGQIGLCGDCQLPPSVRDDIAAGYVITDPDDNHQRCKAISGTCFAYKSGTAEAGDEYAAVIDVAALSPAMQEAIIAPYYGTLDNFRAAAGDYYNTLLAGCQFEALQG